MRGKKMIKSYITTLSVVLLAGTQFVQAQGSETEVLANLNDAKAAVVEVNDAPVKTKNIAKAKDSSLYDRACASYKAKKYDEAKKMFEAMVAADKYDTRPARYLKRIAARVNAIETKKAEASRKLALTEVKKGWTETPPVMIATNQTKVVKKADPRDKAIKALEAKIKTIIVPTIDFREAKVKDVIFFLSETCRRLDKKGRGINILLLGMGSYNDDKNLISISIRDMSLYDALEYITEMAKLRFEIKPSAIAIMPIDYATSAEMELRTFNIKSNTVGDEIAAAANSGGAAAAPAAGGTDDIFGGGAAATPAAGGAGGPLNVAGFFALVKFPEGAKAVYQPKFKKLMVKNTPENLKRIEQVLGEMEDKANAQLAEQVKIDAKFIEFNEGSMEQLGFDWTPYGTGTIGGFGMKDGSYFQKASGFLTPRTPYDPNFGNGDVYVPGTTPTPMYNHPISGYQEINGQGQNLFGLGQRNASQVFEVAKSGVLSTMSGTPAAMVFGNGTLDLRITALEQNGTADVLSAPSITTKSGNEAIIRVVEVHRYPQDYDVETGRNTTPVVKPQDWEDFDLGVSLKVTPVVNADNGTIDLDLTPEITKFKGYDNYIVGYDSVLTGGDYGSGVTAGGSGGALLARMPYFEKRIITTQVTIADGSSILMGGLVNETTETYRDQVPFLGDIPYVGRLFRTEGSRSAKKNLVIYVKAKQIDVNGMSSEDRKQIRNAQINN
jgi:general secretion pathway protein D